MTRVVHALALSILLVAPASAQVVPVADEAELLAAIAAASPGEEIVLAPGTYDLDVTRVDCDRAGLPGAPITVRASFPGCATVRFSTPGSFTEGFLVRAPHWIFEGLVIEGACATDDQCEHAFHVVGDADFFTLRDCIVRDFNAQLKANGTDDGSGRVFPDDALIERNEIYDSRVRQTGNPVTPIDVVGGRRWTVRDNFIHDAAKGGGNGISYQAFLKGNSRDGLFEGNVVACEWLHAPGPGQFRLGLSFGGGGSSPDPICEDGDCSIEHQGGRMIDNVILSCNDVGIYLNEARDCRVLHNTLHANAGIDVRFAASVVELRNNLLTGRIRERDGGTAILGVNVQQVGDAAFESWFRDPARRDFTLVGDGSAFVDRGEPLAEAGNDYCGSPRGATPDLGAMEYEGPTCDTTLVPALLSVPPGTPPAGPGASLRGMAAALAPDVSFTWAGAGDSHWNVYRALDPATGAGLLVRRLTRPRAADRGVLGDGASYYYWARALEPCSGEEAD